MKKLIAMATLVFSINLFAKDVTNDMSNVYADPDYKNGKLHVRPFQKKMTKDEYQLYYKNLTKNIYNNFCSAEKFKSNKEQSSGVQVTIFHPQSPTYKRELAQDKDYCESVKDHPRSKLEDQIKLAKSFNMHNCHRLFHGIGHPIAKKLNDKRNGAPLKNCLSVPKQLTVKESLEFALAGKSQQNVEFALSYRGLTPGIGIPYGIGMYGGYAGGELGGLGEFPDEVGKESIGTQQSSDAREDSGAEVVSE